MLMNAEIIDAQAYSTCLGLKTTTTNKDGVIKMLFYLYNVFRTNAYFIRFCRHSILGNKIGFEG